MPAVVLRQGHIFWLISSKTVIVTRTGELVHHPGKLVHHHTPSRSRDKSNHIYLPHGRKSRLHIGCSQGVFPLI